MWIKYFRDECLGYRDLIFNPKSRHSWGGAFNGQEFRQKIFQQIISAFEFDYIVETGTFRGTTTRFMSRHFSKDIYTVESNRRSYGYSKLRFLFNSSIRVSHGDSRTFLRNLAVTSNFPLKTIFFYLDAHWHEDLPLLEELECIFTTCPQAVVMIDDFKVPDDDGYGYDEYGSDHSLTTDYLSQLSAYPSWYFFPVMHSSLETGKKRGCIVITNSSGIQEQLSNLDTLRFHETSSH
jgi:hypothetical protein